MVRGALVLASLWGDTSWCCAHQAIPGLPPGTRVVFGCYLWSTQVVPFTSPSRLDLVLLEFVLDGDLLGVLVASQWSTQLWGNTPLVLQMVTSQYFHCTMSWRWTLLEIKSVPSCLAWHLCKTREIVPVFDWSVLTGCPCLGGTWWKHFFWYWVLGTF